MGILNIELAEREGARLVLGLGGQSGGGKTFTALQVAWGLANYDASRVGLLCTENRRGRLYANALRDSSGKVHRFKVGDLVAPFSPNRYIDAIAEFAAAGVDVLVIDSVSHEWEGLGGCEEIAMVNPAKPNWNTAKREHKRFMNAMLQSPMHIIACLRAREKVRVTEGGRKVESIGVQPIQEKNFVFELTVSAMLWAGGTQREILKCPAELEPIFGKTGEWAEGYLTAEHGARLRAWVDGAKQLDPEIQRARESLQMVAEQGLEALQSAWLALPANVRAAINPKGCPADLKAAAQEFDRLRAEAQPGGQELADLNAEVGAAKE